MWRRCGGGERGMALTPKILTSQASLATLPRMRRTLATGSLLVGDEADAIDQILVFEVELV